MIGAPECWRWLIVFPRGLVTCDFATRNRVASWCSHPGIKIIFYIIWPIFGISENYIHCRLVVRISGDNLSLQLVPNLR